MNSVAAESLPIAATVLHGAGDAALQEFRNANAVGTLLRFAAVRSGFEALGIEDRSAGQLDLLNEWLFALPASRMRGICEDPAFAIWLRDAECNLRGEATTATPSELAALLPYVFLRHLPEIAPAHVWTLLVPASGRLAPIGLEFRISPHNGHATSATLASSGDLFELALEDGRKVRFACTQRGVLELDHAASETIVRRRRTFLDIELHDPETFPELARMNDGSSLSAASVDVHDYLARAMGALLEAWSESIPDIVAVFRGVVALNSPNDHVYSASTDRAPFLMQLTVREHESRIVLAEMIVHEAAHIKLHLLSTLDPLIVDNGERLYTHPWRRDLRPITGVLFGVHAFLNVLTMYEHAVRAGIEMPLALREAQLRRSEVHEALSTLGDHARFTDAGARFYAQMCRAAGLNS